MARLRGIAIHTTVVAALLCTSIATAQEMPSEYKEILTALGKSGDFKDGVLKVNVPRKDVTVTIGSRPAPTPFGFGGWIALNKGSEGHDVMMGDLVLTEDEVNPVMSAILDNGLDVTALHNHFFWEQPRMFYMHVHGMGSTADLARRVKPAIDLIDQAAKRAPQSATAATAASSSTLDGAALARIVGHEGEQSGPVYKITIGRPDIDLREHGAIINARMGLNTWAAFTGTDADAMVAGDVAMLEGEVTPVLTALRSHGLNVVAIHHHMTGVKPMVVFLHYYGTGPAATLANGVRAAIDPLGKPAASGRTIPRILFICPHGAAKSVLASAYFQRMAQERGLNVQVDFAGTEPDRAVAPKVVERLKARGYPLPTSQPRRVTAAEVSSADVVISMGCDLTGLSPATGALRRWDDVPAPSEDFDGADEAILKRVAALVEELAYDKKLDTR
jgi:protein-tyrosine-phosphatase